MTEIEKGSWVTVATSPPLATWVVSPASARGANASVAATTPLATNPVSTPVTRVIAAG